MRHGHKCRDHCARADLSEVIRSRDYGISLYHQCHFICDVCQFRFGPCRTIAASQRALALAQLNAVSLERGHFEFIARARADLAGMDLECTVTKASFRHLCCCCCNPQTVHWLCCSLSAIAQFICARTTSFGVADVKSGPWTCARIQCENQCSARI